MRIAGVLSLGGYAGYALATAGSLPPPISGTMLLIGVLSTILTVAHGGAIAWRALRSAHREAAISSIPPDEYMAGRRELLRAGALSVALLGAMDFAARSPALPAARAPVGGAAGDEAGSRRQGEPDPQCQKCLEDCFAEFEACRANARRCDGIRDEIELVKCEADRLFEIIKCLDKLADCAMGCPNIDSRCLERLREKLSRHAMHTFMDGAAKCQDDMRRIPPGSSNVIIWNTFVGCFLRILGRLEVDVVGIAINMKDCCKPAERQQ